MTRAGPWHGDGEHDGGDPEVDLHGLRPDEALRRVAQELHACRVKHRERLRVITGRGWGNLRQQPVLRPKVEQWLQSADGRRLGVVGFEVAGDGGSLIVHLRAEGRRDGGDVRAEEL